MERILGPYAAALHALLRMVAGFLFFQHGLPKLFGGAAIAIGLFTSPIAFVASGEMAVAYFQAHLPRGFWPVANGGELAAIFCFVFLYFAATGAGKWSLDALRKGGQAPGARL